MKILVTGGTGVIGAAVIPELLANGHQVRVLSRNAEEDAKRWKNVEPVAGDVADANSLRGTCTTCDGVIHVAGIATEHPPEVTFQKVNVDGTRNIVTEAERSAVRRFVFVSSLGADNGSSNYHRSKREAEEIVTKSGLDWMIVRPGSVYGPGDEVISNILKMVRALPAVPVVDDGEQPFQPIWYEDLGKALLRCVEGSGRSREIIEIAGRDVTTLNDLLRRLSEITDRSPIRVPVPMALASLAAKMASLAIDVPFDETKLTMLREKNVLSDPEANPLEQLVVEPTSLDEGLRKLADALPEQMAEEGIGSMHHKSFWVDITGSPHSPSSLMTLFRERITDIMPIEFAAEPGAATKIEKGATMTGDLPLRGHFQVRVEVAEPTRVVFATLEGHPLAGIVEFTTAETDAGLRFAIDVYTRAANLLDFIAVRTVGEPPQTANWKTVARNVIEASGGSSSGVQTRTEKLDEEAAEQVEKRIRSMVQSRQRDESPPAERPAQR